MIDFHPIDPQTGRSVGDAQSSRVYHPKDQNIENLGIKGEMCGNRFDVFPRTTDEEKRHLELLKRAYIDTRLVHRSLRVG